MKLQLNVETLEVLLGEHSAEVHGGTGITRLGCFLKGKPLGQSSDLCCRSGSCPKPPPAAPKPKVEFKREPMRNPLPPDMTKFCGHPQLKQGPLPGGKKR
jgi:hypothetical protein